MKDELGDRMKGYYESVTQTVLPRRTYTIIRLDGVAFHTLTKKCDKPFDQKLVKAMNKVTETLCEEIQGVVFAYTQSDEISLLLTDFGTIMTQPWFGGNVLKITSVSASIATSEFAKYNPTDIPGRFDSRVFTIPDPTEVQNYFVWRQKDCTRNSILSLAQSQFGAKDIHGKNCTELLEMIDRYSGKIGAWEEYWPDRFRIGLFLEKKSFEENVSYEVKGELKVGTAMRNHWGPADMPIFTEDPEWLRIRIPRYP